MDVDEKLWYVTLVILNPCISYFHLTVISIIIGVVVLFIPPFE